MDKKNIGTPLTLEQLREMDGKPVWGVSQISGKPGEWFIVRIVEMNQCWFIACAGSSQSFGDKDTYGQTWFTYAYPPAHIDREAWEPCLFCCEERKGRKTLAFDEAGDAVTIEIDGNAAAIESDSMGFIIKFCPECGRPLTDKAWDELEKRLRG